MGLFSKKKTDKQLIEKIKLKAGQQSAMYEKESEAFRTGPGALITAQRANAKVVVYDLLENSIGLFLDCDEFFNLDDSLSAEGVNELKGFIEIAKAKIGDNSILNELSRVATYRANSTIVAECEEASEYGEEDSLIPKL